MPKLDLHSSIALQGRGGTENSDLTTQPGSGQSDGHQMGKSGGTPGTGPVLTAWSWPPRVRPPQPLREPPVVPERRSPPSTVPAAPSAGARPGALGPRVPIRVHFLHRELNATS